MTALVPPPRSAPAPGRNDPCPCGSGKKFKQCCGNAAAARPVGAAPPVSAPPNATVAALEQALRHFRAGQWAPAEALLCALLARQPGDANAWHLLGLVAQRSGRTEQAAEWLRRAVALAPRAGVFVCNLGSVLLAQDQIAQAAACFERGVALLPGDPDAHNGLGVSRLRQGRWSEALACFEHVLSGHPEHAKARYNRGLLELKCGRPAQAIAHFEQSAALDPRHAPTHNDWGAALRDLGRIDAAALRFEHATGLQADFADAFYNLSTVQFEQSRAAAALASLRRCDAIRPEPKNAIRSATSMSVVHADAASIDADRQRMQSGIQALMQQGVRVDDPLGAVLGPCFFLAYHGRESRALQVALAGLYLAACPTLAWHAPGCGTTRSADGRLRIGFVSAFFRDHTVGDVMVGLLEQIDRSRFEVTLFRFGAAPDALAQRIDRAVERVIALEPALDSARRRIALESLDLLCYPEVGMDPATYFLAFSRLAPVQCVMWGHPDTTGVPNLDYYISAAEAEPDGAAGHYSEQLVRLPTISAYYQRPVPDAGPVAPLEHFGLPADAHLYLCPQTLYKFHPDFDAVVAALLRRDPSGVLVVFHGRSVHWGEQLMQRFARSFPDVAQRVKFLDRLPRREYFGLLCRAHAVLDTLHFGGGNTAYQALGLGVPLVTWPGSFARGRFTHALYQQMGMTDLVAHSAEAYVEIAFRLADDATFRAAMVAKIQRLSPAIFDNLTAARELEGFFTQAVESARRAG